ncbi:MAG: hypothetical protein ACR2I2_20375 [Bryobacteraceae bacterium]
MLHKTLAEALLSLCGRTGARSDRGKSMDRDETRDMSIDTIRHNGGKVCPPKSICDLLPTEQWLIAAMEQIGFGRMEFLQIRDGQLVLDPRPDIIRDVKFAANKSDKDKPNSDFPLKRQLIELLEYIRSVRQGEIRSLFIRHGLPFQMEIQVTPEISF